MRSIRIKCKCAFALFAAVVGLSSHAWSMNEAQQRQFAKRLGAITVFTSTEVQRFRANKPSTVLEIRGQVSGIVGSSDDKALMIQLADGPSVEIKAASLPQEIQSGSRVKALAKNWAGAANGALQLKGISLDSGHYAPLSNRPAAGYSGWARSSRSRRIPSELAYLPSRGGDEQVTRCQRAIAYFNPRLSAREVALIATSIVGYSRYMGIDPYFVVAVVAAESRFNPSARSYKGAMGLGQLMPGTARGMGVRNAWDPAENLAGAITLLSNHVHNYLQQHPGDLSTAYHLALSAYNAGSGAVRKYGGVPPYRETRNYIWKIYEYHCWMYGIQPESRRR